VFDSDNSGTIDRNEIMKTFQGLGYEIDIEKADAMIKKVDTSGKG
jgi:Ca2+-binding EF-hand superfamily protein